MKKRKVKNVEMHNLKAKKQSKNVQKKQKRKKNKTWRGFCFLKEQMQKKHDVK